MSNFRAGVLALVVIGLATFFGVTKTNPFANPYEFEAVFRDANNVKQKSPVRIAGVEVGKVTKIEALEDESPGGGAAKVTIEMKDEGLPIKEDAELKVRPRIFLEGNFFVDLEPGTPSAEELDDGGTIPVTQTAAPVQFGDVLSALQRDTRDDLQGFLREYSDALADGGAEGFNESIEYWAPAYKGQSLMNDALLGQDPDRDLQRVLSGQQKTAEALARDEEALKGLVTNFNVTAGALASEDVALAASIPALRDTLRSAQPALGRPERGAAERARVRPRGAAGRALLRRDARRGAAVHAPGAPADVAGGAARHGDACCARRSRQSWPSRAARSRCSGRRRALSACTNNVLVPFTQLEVPNPDEPENDGQKVRQPVPARIPGACRREPPLRRQQPVLPRRRDAAQPAACGPGRRRTAAASRLRTAPTFRARRSRCRTCRRRAARSRASSRSSSPPAPRCARAAAKPPVGDELLGAVKRFANEGWPAIEKARAAYQEREQRAARQGAGR